MTRREGIKLFLLIGVLLIMAWFLIELFSSHSGIAATAKEFSGNVPDDAADIRYYFPPAFGPARYYDFSVSEAAYRKWISDYWKIDSIDEGAFSIFRYNIESGMVEEVEVEHGLLAERLTGADSGVHAGYDLKTGRAYCYVHSR